MKQDTINFLETLLFCGDCDIDTSVQFQNKTVYDFSPAFVEAVEKFIGAFRAHLESTGFPVEKLDDAERSFGGNVYLSLSGHGAGFFDDSDEDVAGLQEVIQKWSGWDGKCRRFEELAGMLDEAEDGKIDLAFVPEALEEQRARIFRVPEVKTPPEEEKGGKYTQGPWTHEGQGAVAHPGTHGTIITERIGTGGYGEIEIIDTTNEPDYNLTLIRHAPDMLRALEDAARILKIAHQYFPKSIKNRDTFDLCNIENNSVLQAIAKAKGVQ